MAAILTEAPNAGRAADPTRGGYRRRGSYLLVALPALLVILAVILFPWLFTIFLSMHDWPVVGERTFVGAGNYLQLASDPRFIEAIGRTFYFTFLAVALPVVMGIPAAVAFHREFPLRGFWRAIFPRLPFDSAVLFTCG